MGSLREANDPDLTAVWAQTGRRAIFALYMLCGTGVFTFFYPLTHIVEMRYNAASEARNFYRFSLLLGFIPVMIVFADISLYLFYVDRRWVSQRRLKNKPD